jgi:hypothetical protein
MQHADELLGAHQQTFDIFAGYAAAGLSTAWCISAVTVMMSDTASTSRPIMCSPRAGIDAPEQALGDSVPARGGHDHKRIFCLHPHLISE